MTCVFCPDLPYITNNLAQIQLMDPNAEWELTNAWFVRQKNIIVKLSRV